jgi:hypothetical protein
MFDKISFFVNEIFIKEGEYCKNIYILISGSVELFQKKNNAIVPVNIFYKS